MDPSSDFFSILHFIANDCYKMGHFYYASRAFDILAKFDSDHEYENTLKGSFFVFLEYFKWL